MMGCVAGLLRLKRHLIFGRSRLANNDDSDMIDECAYGHEEPGGRAHAEESYGHEEPAGKAHAEESYGHEQPGGRAHAEESVHEVPSSTNQSKASSEPPAPHTADVQMEALAPQMEGQEQCTRSQVSYF